MLPRLLQNYLDMLRNEAPVHPYSQACAERGIKEVNTNIGKLFREARRYTGMTASKLLKDLDFDVNDRDPDRIQSLFGVLRTIIALRTQLGFAEIKPLPRQSDRRETDLLAVRKDARFAVEVVRSNERTYRWPGLIKGDFNQYIINVWNKKWDQIMSSMKNHDCQKGILAVVLDSGPMKGGSMTPHELSTAVEEASWRVISTNNMHLLVFTGEWYYGEGEPMTAVFPPLL